MPGQGVDAVFLGKRDRDDIKQVFCCCRLFNRLHAGELELERQSSGQSQAVQGVLLEEDLAEADAALLLLRQGRVNLRPGNLEVLL